MRNKKEIRTQLEILWRMYKDETEIYTRTALNERIEMLEWVLEEK